MKKSPKLPPVIRAPQELVEKMQRLSELPPLTSEQMKAQVQATLRQRNGGETSRVASSSGRRRRAA